MNILDRYIFSQFTRNLALVISALITVYLLVDFFEKIDNFVNAGKSTSLAFKYLLLKIPLIIDQLLPVCMLLAGIITLGVMNQNREAMALEAGGISIKRLTNPILATAIFFSLLALVSGEWLVPATISETNRIWYEEVKRTKTQGIVRHGQVYYKGKEGLYSFRRSPKSKTNLNNFSYTTWDESFSLKLQVTAGTATWEEGTWFFLNGQLKKLSPDGSYTHKIFANHEMLLPDNPEDFFIPAYKYEEATLSDHLKEVIHKSEGRLNAWRNLNRRLSYIFLGFPLVLLGLPMLMLANQRWQKDLSLAIPISCIMAFIAWGWWSTSQAMIKAYSLSPLLASWSAHLLTGALGFYMLKRQSKQPM
jgi:lipopolysaccharide export system permease protein